MERKRKHQREEDTLNSASEIKVVAFENPTSTREEPRTDCINSQQTIVLDESEALRIELTYPSPDKYYIIRDSETKKVIAIKFGRLKVLPESEIRRHFHSICHHWFCLQDNRFISFHNTMLLMTISMSLSDEDKFP